MPWRIEFSATANRDLAKLDPHQKKRILAYLQGRVALLADPRSIGKALLGPRFGELWRYRVGDFRLVCKIEDIRVVVLVLRIATRKDIYR